MISGHTWYTNPASMCLLLPCIPIDSNEIHQFYKANTDEIQLTAGSDTEDSNRRPLAGHCCIPTLDNAVANNTPHPGPYKNKGGIRHSKIHQNDAADHCWICTGSWKSIGSLRWLQSLERHGICKSNTRLHWFRSHKCIPFRNRTAHSDCIRKLDTRRRPICNHENSF